MSDSAGRSIEDYDLRDAQFEPVDTGSIETEDELKQVLDRLEAGLQTLHFIGCRWRWERYTQGESQIDPLQLVEKRNALLRHEPYRRLVEKWLTQAETPRLKRRLELWLQQMVRQEVDGQQEVFPLVNDIRAQILEFQPHWDGKDQTWDQMRRILRQEVDQNKRRTAWEADLSLGRQIAGQFEDLFRRRNWAAEAAGYENYVDFCLDLAGLSQDELDAWIQRLEEATEAVYRRWLEQVRQQAGLSRVHAWDLHYLFSTADCVPGYRFPREQILFKLWNTVRMFGLDPDELGIDPLNIDIPEGTLTVAVNPPAEIRMLTLPGDGYDHYAQLFREYGKAVYAAQLSDSIPFICLWEPDPFIEGMGQIWERFTVEPSWLGIEMGLTADEIERLQTAQRGQQIFRVRCELAATAFERRAYDDPDVDLDAVYAEMLRRYLAVEPEKTPKWAVDMARVESPLNPLHRLVGRMIAAQTHIRLQQQFDPVVGEPAAAGFLSRHYWTPGATVPWQTKVRQATGEALGPGALVQELVE